MQETQTHKIEFSKEGYASKTDQGKGSITDELIPPEGRYVVILYIRGDKYLLSKPIGSIPNIKVERNQETNLGKIPMQNLFPIIHH